MAWWWDIFHEANKEKKIQKWFDPKEEEARERRKIYFEHIIHTNTKYTCSKEVESTLAKIQRNNIVIYLLAHLLDCVLRTYIPSIIWRTTALRQSCFRFFQLEVWVLFIVDCWNSQQHFEMDATLDFQCTTLKIHKILPYSTPYSREMLSYYYLVYVTYDISTFEPSLQRWNKR